MRLRLKTIAGAEAVLEIDPDLPLAVVRAQAASALELDSEASLVHEGRLLKPDDDDKFPQACGLHDGSMLVAVAKKPRLDTIPAASSSNAAVGIERAQAANAVSPSTWREGPGDDEIARQAQADEDEVTARRVQEEVDSTLAREEQVRQAMGDARAAEMAAVPQLVCVRGEIIASGTWIPLVIDTGAQTSILTSGLAERLGLLHHLDRTMAGVAGGIGQARVLGKLRGIVVKFGELELEVDFQILDGSQMPMPNLALLGLDQLAVHHMVVDLDVRVLRIGGCEGYSVRMLEDYEIPMDFRPNAAMAQRCSIQ
jgi:hypothetical protein